MKILIYSLVLISMASSALAQSFRHEHATTRQLRKLSFKFSRQKNAEQVVANLQSLIAAAQSSHQFGTAIYFELLLGEQYEKTNDFGAAENILVQAYTEAKAHLPGRGHKYYLIRQQNQTTYFDALDRLGYFYLTIGNLRRAEQLFQESRQLRDAFFPTHSIHRIHPIVGLGSCYFRKGDYNKTYQLFNLAQASMARATTTGYDFDNLNRLFLNDLVELCLILNKKEEALKFINRLFVASSGFTKFNSAVSSRLEIARLFELKARYFLMLGDFTKTNEYLERANYYKPAGLATSRLQLKLLKTKCLLLWYQNDLPAAATAFEELITAYRKHIARNFAAMSDYEREQFYYTLKDDFDLFNAFVLENPQLLSAGLTGVMYDNILNTKALLLNATDRLKSQILQSGDQALIGKLTQWEELKNELASLYFEQNNSAQIDELEKKIEDLERQINQGSELFQKTHMDVSWKSVQTNLKEGEAAVEIVRVNRFDRIHPQLAAIHNGLTDSVVYLALLIQSRSAQPEGFVLAGKKLETYYLPYYRNSIVAQNNDNLSYDHFWKPLRSHLTGIGKVFLSADGVYNQINLNTLKNPSTQRYLIDETDLALVTNTADLLAPRSAQKTQRAVLVGKPAFSFSEKKISITPHSAETLPKGLRSMASEQLLELRDQDFADLPGTAEEVTQIGRELEKQSMQVQTYIGENATEENIKKLNNPEILHIATHGFFVDDTARAVSPMIRSGIILAGVQNPEIKNRDDGVLTAYEATNLRLENTDLVVLSACETGLGEVRNGEGVYGLQRSIIVAGANNLLMSLWRVDDAATAKLMTTFYRLRARMSNTAAFREAQVELRADYPEPFFWGAFVMLGK